MPAFNRIIISGNLPDGEQWSTGIAFSGLTGPGFYDDFNDLQTWANAIKTDVISGAWGSALMGALSANGNVQLITVQTLDADGTLELSAESPRDLKTGTGTAGLPHQAAVVLSSRSGRPGRSFRGRNYWPAIGVGLASTTLKIDPSNAASLATDWKDVLNLMKLDQPGTLELVPVIWSPKLGTGIRVETITVGDVVDTQRRRRNRVPEVYHSVEL